MEKVLAVLGEPTADALRNPPPLSTWFPYALLVEVDRAITYELMGADLRQMRVFGARVAEYDFEKTYAHLLRMVTSLRFFLQRSPTIWSLYFRGGSTLHPIEVRDGGARLVQRGVVFPRYMCRYGITGWLESVARFYSAEVTELVHAQCRHDGDPECEWRLAWR